jgi:peptide/nickel transport system ATP-binding protein/oligopeptide transport system ATP-binding protein
LLDIRNLAIEFDGEAGRVRAVDGVSFVVRRGEVLGLVGESGCGKSITALSVMRLLPSPPGRIADGSIGWGGRDLLELSVPEMRRIRGRQISMIFQDPMSALSPLHTIGRQLVETVRIHRPIPRREAWALGEGWLRKVGIPDPAQRMHSLPHELSGGMRQRVMIAMAMMLEPELVMADEPTTALDVTIQAQIFDLMRQLRDARTSLLLITHDMGVIWEMCDRVLVMYAGRIVEEGPVKAVFAQPRHPYTAGLLKSMPRSQQKGRRLISIPGQVPAPGHMPAGCRFADRCPHVHPRCRQEDPPACAVTKDHHAACFLVPEGRLP